MRKNLFTILSTAYKKANFLKKWADSIISQDYRPIEVILVDDASRDSTGERAANIVKLMRRAGITLYYVPMMQRVYCASAYLTAHRHGHGEWFGVLDADDMLAAGAVSHVVQVYREHPEARFVYTQFMECNQKMVPRKKGFCKAPATGQSLLDLAISGKGHGYSHWRTFSALLPDQQSIWSPGLRCAVDKYMGYRLEELGPGVFTDHVCYLYRGSTAECITRNEKTRDTWRSVVKGAVKRRRKFELKPYPIITA